MITNDTPDWDSDDSLALRAFLQTRAGERLLPRILSSAPALLASGDVNAILIRNGEFRGWQAVSRELLSLAFPSPEQPTTDHPSNYPPLEKDSAWDQTN